MQKVIGICFGISSGYTEQSQNSRTNGADCVPVHNHPGRSYSLQDDSHIAQLINTIDLDTIML